MSRLRQREKGEAAAAEATQSKVYISHLKWASGESFDGAAKVESSASAINCERARSKKSNNRCAHMSKILFLLDERRWRHHSQLAANEQTKSIKQNSLNMFVLSRSIEKKLLFSFILCLSRSSLILSTCCWDLRSEEEILLMPIERKRGYLFLSVCVHLSWFKIVPQPACLECWLREKAQKRERATHALLSLTATGACRRSAGKEERMDR